MSSKKFDHPAPPARLTEAPRRSPWVGVLLSNWWLPLLLLLLPAARFIEDPDKVTGYHTSILLQIGVTIIAAVSLQLINGISGQFSLGHAGFMAVGAYAAGYGIQNFSTAAVQTEDLAADRYVNPGGVLLFFAAMLLSVGMVGGAISLALAGVRRLPLVMKGIPGTSVRPLRWFTTNVAAIVGGLVILWMAVDLIAYTRTGVLQGLAVWARLFVGANHLYDGVISHGAGAANWLTHHSPPSWRQPLTMLAALIGCGILAGAAGWLVGLPTLRLRGDYLAIATLGFAEIIRIVITNAKPLGRATGLQIPPYAIQPDPTNDPPIVGHYVFPWIFGTAILTVTLIGRLKRSAKGRAIQAVREDEIAARAVGIDNVHHKVIAFVIGAFFAGVAGGLFGTFQGYVNPNNFDFGHSVDLVVIVTLGGLGSISGAIIVAVILTTLPEILKDPKQWLEFLLGPILHRLHVQELTLSPRVAAAAKWVSENQRPIFALVLVGLMLAKYGDFSFLKPRGRTRGVKAFPAQPAAA